ncbi:MAG: DUF3524 domain-containing protein [Gammaproteobacteria bacterium]|nr:DUF3524 domain-containing protein [Gammaproteobacteria bacterium]MCP4881384.1 DUF3524 domain-containing protein [Gammaproteobacteria bacterium]MDP6165405.1 DUF3524 domain-containing protein [Gammaproteobacteria bacterium]
MRVLLLSAYDADSHRYWRQHLVAQFPDYHWTELVLPGRYFNWRIRGNSLQWALTQRTKLEQGYDLIVATSMVDLSALKGMVPKLAAIPSLVYFHENQFAYPVQLKERHKQIRIEPMIVNLYSAVCANSLAFNSAYNRDSFLEGVKNLLRWLPEKLPLSLIDDLSEKSHLLPVPIKLLEPVAEVPNRLQSPIQLIWNHRWEYDKGPDLLYASLVELQNRGIAFKLHLLGQQFRQQPQSLKDIQVEFASQLGQVGYLDNQMEYESLLQQADMVLSTADHEFQGLAVSEAIQCGCLPVLPNRLSYPGLVGADLCYKAAADLHSQATALVDRVVYWQSLDAVTLRQKWQGLPVRDYHWQHLRSSYESLMRTCAGFEYP